MEITEVETRVKQAIARVLQMDVAEIDSDSNFIFDLGADSHADALSEVGDALVFALYVGEIEFRRRLFLAIVQRISPFC